MTGPSVEQKVELTERDLSAVRYAAQVVRRIEEQFKGDPLTGVAEGEATSDVLLSICARAEAVSD